MKKFISFLSAVMCVITFGVVLTACGEKPVSIEVKEGTLDTELYVGETLNYDSVVLLVTYNNDEVKEVAKNDEMTFSTIDTLTPGDKTLTITYKKLTVDVTITVIEEQHEPVITYEITTFSLPTFITDFATNAEAFNLKQNTYKIGDDNAFALKPIIVGREIVDGERGQITSLEYIPSTFKVEQKSGEQYTELVGDNLTNVVTIDERSYSFDFNDAAVGNTYKITVSADTTTGEKSINFEFEVVDGYNIQSKAELSVIDNNANTQDEWAELKQANNVPDVNPNAVVIHGSYVLTDEDVPSAYYYYKGDNDLGDRFDEVVGTLRNWKSIYSHDTPSGSTYTIYGNYNTIDASAIAITRCDIISQNTSDTQTSGHSALFGFGGDNNDHPTTMQGDVVVDSLNLVGNANRSEDELLVGGLLMLITNSNDTLIKNCVASTWLTNMVAHASAETWENSTHILECNFSDSFSNMLYFYGIKNNYIENSNLVGSGGPLFALTHVDASKDTSRWSNMEVKNSHLETHVTGSEAWFVLNKANETATSLFALDKIFSGTSQALVAKGMLQNAKSFKDETETANFIGMVIADGDPFSNSIPLKGKMTFKDAEGNVEYVYDMEDPNFKALSGSILPTIGQIAPDQVAKLPFFNAGGIITTLQLGADYKPEGLSQDLSTPFVKEDGSNIADVKKFFESDYLGLYINGIPTIGALVEFYNVDNL